MERLCREVKAGMSLLLSTVRALQVTPKRGVWSMERAPGASLGRMGKPKQASHKEHFCWDVFSSKLFLKVFLPGLLSPPSSAPDLQGAVLTGCTPAGIFSPWVQDGSQAALVAGLSCLFLISRRIYTMKSHRWKLLPHLADSCVLASTRGNGGLEGGYPSVWGSWVPGTEQRKLEPFK